MEGQFKNPVNPATGGASEAARGRNGASRAIDDTNLWQEEMTGGTSSYMHNEEKNDTEKKNGNSI